ncbi:hypothetical protein HDU77_000995, partial [Chytriomyces hyalinus]
MNEDAHALAENEADELSTQEEDGPETEDNDDTSDNTQDGTMEDTSDSDGESIHSVAEDEHIQTLDDLVANNFHPFPSKLKATLFILL